MERIIYKDIETPDLQSFLDVVKDKDDHASVRVKTVTWNGAVEVITLKLDNQYWPAYDVHRTEDGWVRKEFDAPVSTASRAP